MTRPHAGGCPPSAPVATRLDITKVGACVYDSGPGVVTLNITTHNLGDIIVLGTNCYASVEPNTVTNVTGGGVALWERITSFWSPASLEDTEQWYGVVTTVGVGLPINITKATAGYSCLMAQEYTTGNPNAKWYWYAGTGNASTGPVPAFPNQNFVGATCTLTPQGSKELYLALTGVGNSGLMANPQPGYSFTVIASDTYTMFTDYLNANNPNANVADWSSNLGAYSQVAAYMYATT